MMDIGILDAVQEALAVVGEHDNMMACTVAAVVEDADVTRRSWSGARMPALAPDLSICALCD
jgi:hypothetical protein